MGGERRRYHTLHFHSPIYVSRTRDTRNAAVALAEAPVAPGLHMARFRRPAAGHAGVTLDERNGFDARRERALKSGGITGAARREPSWRSAVAQDIGRMSLSVKKFSDAYASRK